MFNRIKIALFIMLPAMLSILPGKAVAYQVSGVVEFSSRWYETKIGNVRSSDYIFTQTYLANIGSFVWDPRFLRFNAGAGYTEITSKNSTDYNTLSYHANAAFFPGLKVSWELYGSRSTSNVESTSNIAGYDVISNSYGGGIRLNLGRPGRTGNNNNGNFNNNFNNNWSGFTLPLPDISISRNHAESESLSVSNPLHETRDDTKASLMFRRNSSYDVILDGIIEDYKNLRDNSSYDTKTAVLTSNFRFSPRADFQLTGRMTDRSTQNLAGFDTSITQWYSNAVLNLRSKSGLHHYYQYGFAEERTTGTNYTTHRGDVRVVHNIIPELQVQGGLNYSLSEYVIKATALRAEEKTTLESGGALAGAMYGKTYKPGFLEPFVFRTSYNVTTGFSEISGQNAGTEGNGWYYSNSVGLGLISVGWDKENASVDYSYISRRDHSPLANDVEEQSYQLTLWTRRIPKTSIRASANYRVSENKSAQSSVFLSIPQDTSQQHRTLLYNVVADHLVSPYLTLSAGASRGESKSSSYTLSTLAPAGQATTQDDLLYATANFIYPFTRNLTYRANVREEFRKTQITDTQSHELIMNINYRIRQILLSFEYRWRQDIHEEATRATQQYYFARLSRPF